MPLSVSNEEQRRKAITQLQQLRQSPGWKLIAAHLKELLAEADRAIMIKGGNEARYSEKDLLIERRGVLIDVISQPEKMIEDLSASEEGEVEEYDPYGP